MNISVILPAAGLGRRFAVGGPSGERASGSKIEFELLHKPVFLRSIELFRNSPFGEADVEQIILAVEPGRLEEFRFRWGEQLAFWGVELIAGGEAERWETVKRALERVSDEASHVAVHDAARPGASSAMIERVFAAALKYGAAVPGLAMGDTVKRVASGEGLVASGEGDPLDAIFGEATSATMDVRKISETVSREGLWRVQTPQVFEKGLLVAAYGKLNTGNAAGITDDASVVERAGGAVYIVEGDAMNLKLTTPGDVELMEAVLRLREEKDAKRAAVKELFGDEDED